MRFTNGFWQRRSGVELLHAEAVHRIEERPDAIEVLAPTKVIVGRGDTLNRPVLSIRVSSPEIDVVTIRIEHHRAASGPSVVLPRPAPAVEIEVDDEQGLLRSGRLSARVGRGDPFALDLLWDGRRITGLSGRSVAHAVLQPGADVAGGIPKDAVVAGAPEPLAYTLAQLDLGVGELVYGLGERFGPLVKNWQSVDIWNADGGTSSEQAYKNVPFYLTSAGYGVLVDDTGPVGFEVGSEAVERVQLSVPGQSITFHVIGGGSPRAVLERLTTLTGRPAPVPAWSYGLWLSTSFTTDYDEATVTRFLDGMADRDVPVSVFHFDCFWMREFQWCDFEWDPRVFPDPAAMLERLHARGLRVCVWINPYIAQQSPLFDEAARAGHLVRRPDGSVWQWDLWQAGMGLVDFTDPAATAWYQDKLRQLLRQGVDCLKTDFGERIPLDVAWADGSDPLRTHNRYAHLYNEAVFEVLEQERGRGEAVVFARSAAAGGQRMPVHWGGDSTSTFASMAETLRGGLSLSMSGFGFWSHDIGGFEGRPDPVVFSRWMQFGMLSSHSRLHGSGSYRVPWEFGPEAEEVARRFVALKHQLMPYLFEAGAVATETGTPVMRPLPLAFPEDPGAAYCDREYLLGDDLLVAPVMDPDGVVDYYLPPGDWVDWFTGETAAGPGWQHEQHGLMTLPLRVRAGAVIPLSTVRGRVDGDWLEGLELRMFGRPGAPSTLRVLSADGTEHRFAISPVETGVRIDGPRDHGWSVRMVGGMPVRSELGVAEARL